VTWQAVALILGLVWALVPPLCVSMMYESKGEQK